MTSHALDSRLNLPNLLSGLRLALAPALLGLAFAGQAVLFLPVLVFSLATDVADGFLARRLGQCTALGTRLDSWADLATWAALPLCLVWLRPDFVAAQWPLLGVLVASLLLPVALGLLKFGRVTSYHTYGAKLSGVLLGGAAIMIFASGPLWWVQVTAAVVVLSQLEEIAITACLDEPRDNLKSLVHVLRGLR